MAYGTVKVDNITFTNGGSDQTVTVSGIVQSISGNITATGTIQAATIIGTSTVSGATVTGNVGVFTSITGGTAEFTTITGTTVTGTSSNFVSGVFSAQVSGTTVRGTTVSGATVTGNAGQFTTITGTSAGFTTITGATVTGTTANFATLSGTTITGNTVTVASGTYTGNVTAAAFIPTSSGVPANGLYLPAANSVALATNGVQRLTTDTAAVTSTLPVLHPLGAVGTPSITFTGDLNTGVWSPAADTIAASTGGSERARLTSSGQLLVGTSSANSLGSAKIQLFDSTGAFLLIGTTAATVSSNTFLGGIDFHGSLANRSARILCFADADHGVDDYPSRLTFSTCGDGQPSPTERMRIDGSGRLLVGTTTSTNNIRLNEKLAVVSTGSGNIGGAGFTSYSGTTPDAPALLDLNRSRGIADGSMTIVASGDNLGTIAFAGADGTGFIRAANIKAEVDGTPGANDMPGRLLFSTTADGAASPTERMRIDSSGRLLVGTSSSAQNTTIVLKGNSGTDPQAILYFESETTNPSADGALGVINFADSAENRGAQIAAIADGAWASGDYPGRLVFSTTADGSASPTERLRITSDGKVGLGTSSPTSTSGGLDIASGGLGLVLGADASASTRTNATNKQSRIGGFHYTNAEEPIAIATAISTATGSALYFGGGTSSMNAATELQFYTAANNTTTTGTARMIIDSSGRVGVGTTNPGATLHVEGSELRVKNGTGVPNVTLAGRDTDGTAILAFQNNASSSNNATLTATTNTLAIATGGTERARIDSSGRLLVGTTDSAANARLNSKISVVGTGNNQYPGIIVNGYTGTTDVAAPFIDLARSRGTTDGSYTEVVNNDTLGYLVFRGADGVDWSDAALISAHADGDWTTSGDTTDSPGRLVFSTTADGAATPTERMRITQGGKVGIGITNPQAYNIQADNLVIGGTANEGISIVSGTSNNGQIWFSDADAEGRGRIQYSHSVDHFFIATGDVDCVRIPSGGQLDVVGNNNIISAASAAAAGTTNALYRGYHSGTAGTFLSGTLSFNVATNGNVTNTNGTYTSISDIRLKENIVDASSQWNDIKNIQIRNWNFKTETGHETHRQLGPIAQELEVVCPGLVSELPNVDADGNNTGEVTKIVNQSVLYMKAVKALQEAMERIEILEQRLSDAGIN